MTDHACFENIQWLGLLFNRIARLLSEMYVGLDLSSNDLRFTGDNRIYLRFLLGFIWYVRLCIDWLFSVGLGSPGNIFSLLCLTTGVRTSITILFCFGRWWDILKSPQTHNIYSMSFNAFYTRPICLRNIPDLCLWRFKRAAKTETLTGSANGS